MSCGNGETTFHQSSQLDRPAPITNSLLLTKQSGLELEGDKQSYSLTAMNSHTSTQPFFFPMESRWDQLDEEETATREPDLLPLRSVKGSTVQMDAEAQQEPAISAMLASNANSQDMGKKTALSRHEVSYGMHPKYLRHNIWDAQEEGEGVTHVKSLQCLADWTE